MAEVRIAVGGEFFDRIRQSGSYYSGAVVFSLGSCHNMHTVEDLMPNRSGIGLLAGCCSDDATCINDRVCYSMFVLDLYDDGCFLKLAEHVFNIVQRVISGFYVCID